MTDSDVLKVLEAKAKNIALIRTLSYQDFLENNSYPTKEEIAQAKYDLCLFIAGRCFLEEDVVAAVEPLQKELETRVEIGKESAFFFRNQQDRIRNLEKQLDELRRLCSLWRADIDSRIECYRDAEIDNPKRLKVFWFRQLRDTLLAELHQFEKVESVLKTREKSE
jgi:hypothetical protein